MKLSAQTRYAIRILFELAGTRMPLPVAELSDRTGISLRTVENICAILRYDGISSGISGPGGGMLLQGDMSEISLGRLVDLFEDGVQFSVCCGDKANDCPNMDSCENRAIWRRVSAKVQAGLDDIPLSSLMLRYAALRPLSKG